MLHSMAKPLPPRVRATKPLTITFRVDANLKTALLQAAERDKRTLSQWLSLNLAQLLESKKPHGGR